MVANNTITIERKSSFSGALMSMHIVVDDTVSFWLSNGGFVDIEVPGGQEEFLLQVQDHVFKVVNLKQVKKIILKFGFTGIECSILYNDGSCLDAINKNPGVDVTKTISITAIMIFLLLIFFLHFLITFNGGYYEKNIF